MISSPYTVPLQASLSPFAAVASSPVTPVITYTTSPVAVTADCGLHMFCGLAGTLSVVDWCLLILHLDFPIHPMDRSLVTAVSTVQVSAVCICLVHSSCGWNSALVYV